MGKSNGTPAVKVTKFQSILGAQGQAVLDKRAQLINSSTKKIMESRVRDLEDKRDALELEILNLEDLSVGTRNSLRPGDKNYDANAWVDQQLKLHTELALVEDELTIAEEVYSKYFVTEEEAAATTEA